MLVLTRKLDESIIIGNDIEVKVLKIQGNQVHLGIDAPHFTPVYRHEIYKQVKKENQKAVRTNLEKSNLKVFEKSLSRFQNMISNLPPE